MLAELIASAVLIQSPKPILLAHYMPWYEAKPRSKNWGWHWTMNHFTPEDGKGASRYHPIIGYYDSSDPDVIEFHCLLMKISGIGGVLADWYGTEKLFDYPQIHANTEKLFATCERVGLKFGVVYEDQTVPNLIRNHVITEEDAVASGKRVMTWVEENWVKSDTYLRWEGRPVFSVFGPQFYKPGDWEQIVAGMKSKPAWFTLLGRRDWAFGGFSWPEPQPGEAKSWVQFEDFYKRMAGQPVIAGAYPRFTDVYKEAKVGGYPDIGDDEGRTYRRTLQTALASKAPMVQLITWNDWGEGTQIEPSEEFGYRDLLETMRQTGVRNATYLQLPIRLYRLRKKQLPSAKLDGIVSLIRTGALSKAGQALDHLESGALLQPSFTNLTGD